MAIDEQLIAAANDIAAAALLPPLEAVQERARRRRMRSAATALSTGVVLTAVAGAAVLMWPSSTPSHGARITPASPAPSASASPSGLDFTATVLPPGLAYHSTEHGPANQFEEVIKRYTNADDTHLLIIDVNRGKVMTPAYYGELMGFRLTTVDGHPAAVGAADGRNNAGNVEAFVEISPTVTVDVEDRGGLSLSQVLDVVRGVRVN